MTIRTRLTLTSAVLLVAAASAACGGGGSGAPTDASEKDFCATQTSLFSDLLPDDLTDPEVPSDEDMAAAVKSWGKKLASVGTPDGIPADARAGFEQLVEQASEIDPSDFDIDKLDELEKGGADASAEAQEQAEAFATYLTETCGNPLDDLDLDLPEVPDTTE